MALVRQSDRIRELVAEHYVQPALKKGDLRLSIRVRDVLRDAEAFPDFPRGRTPLICEVLQGKKLLRENGLEIESVEGPPSLQSRTVVVHYRRSGSTVRLRTSSDVQTSAAIAETPAEWAKRLTDKLRGLLKNELAEYGGAEGFIRWTRDEDDDSA